MGPGAGTPEAPPGACCLHRDRQDRRLQVSTGQAWAQGAGPRKQAGVGDPAAGALPPGVCSPRYSAPVGRALLPGRAVPGPGEGASLCLTDRLWHTPVQT